MLTATNMSNSDDQQIDDQVLSTKGVLLAVHVMPSGLVSTLLPGLLPQHMTKTLRSGDQQIPSLESAFGAVRRVQLMPLGLVMIFVDDDEVAIATRIDA